MNYLEKPTINDFKKFLEIYEKRPFKNNDGGLKISHAFSLYFFLKNFKPTTVIESGVHKGGGTYIIRSACPDAHIICLEPYLENIEYKISNCEYLNEDFSLIDFNQYNINKDKTVVFFDDHQDFSKRFYEIYHHNFKHIIFEDNFHEKNNYGDCYSPKQVLANCEYHYTIKKRNLLNIKNFCVYVLDYFTKFLRFKNEYKIKQNFKYSHLTSKLKFFPKDNYLTKATNKYLKIYYEFPQITMIDPGRKFNKLNLNFIYKDEFKFLNEDIKNYYNKSIMFDYDVINNLMLKNNINLNEILNYNFMCYCLFDFKQD